MKGNIILFQEEIQNLRKELVNRYCQLTGQNIADSESLFNSNMENYKGLYESIDKMASLKENGIHSVKPLLSLFYLSKRNPDEGKSFRRRFIDCVYTYIYGHKREGSLLSHKNTQAQTQNTNFIDNLRGYWECYYFNDNTFKRKFDADETLQLNTIAIYINSDSLTGNQLQYIRSQRDYGNGIFEVFGSNVILKLYNKVDNSISILMMNCGKGTIENSSEHIDLLSGIYSFPAEKVEGIKASRCMMLYYDNMKVEKKYGATEINFTNDNMKSIFLSEHQQMSLIQNPYLKEELMQLKSFFYRPYNSTEAYITDFVADSNLLDTYKPINK